jgi:Flp pilus assembly pilin Flp
MNSEIAWKLISTKTEVVVAVPSEGVHALATITRFLNDERGAAVIEFALIAILIAVFIIVALFAVELVGTH